ncbi:MAG: flagellar protein FliB, partial [Clostridiales bacterium]|nr:flagellar protein FliB [Clostridiales bacterium]
DVSTWISNNKVLEFKDQVYIVHLFSKEVEHSEDNIIKLYELFESEEIFSLENIINVILN